LNFNLRSVITPAAPSMRLFPNLPSVIAPAGKSMHLFPSLVRATELLSPKEQVWSVRPSPSQSNLDFFADFLFFQQNQDSGEEFFFPENPTFLSKIRSQEIVNEIFLTGYKIFLCG
jgi:hypothetical protein